MSAPRVGVWKDEHVSSHQAAANLRQAASRALLQAGGDADE